MKTIISFSDLQGLIGDKINLDIIDKICQDCLPVRAYWICINSVYSYESFEFDLPIEDFLSLYKRINNLQAIL